MNDSGHIPQTQRLVISDGNDLTDWPLLDSQRVRFGEIGVPHKGEEIVSVARVANHSFGPAAEEEIDRRSGRAIDGAGPQHETGQAFFKGGHRGHFAGELLLANRALSRAPDARRAIRPTRPGATRARGGDLRVAGIRSGETLTNRITFLSPTAWQPANRPVNCDATGVVVTVNGYGSFFPHVKRQYAHSDCTRTPCAHPVRRFLRHK
jgi:hypothetical protein